MRGEYKVVILIIRIQLIVFNVLFIRYLIGYTKALKLKIVANSNTFFGSRFGYCNGRFLVKQNS
mgnify:CR=1 FL=1